MGDESQDPRMDGAWECCRLRIPPDRISHVVSVLEAYDNQFLVRTENRDYGILIIWYAKKNHLLLEEIVLDIQVEFPASIMSFSDGMEGLDEVFPE